MEHVQSVSELKIGLAIWFFSYFQDLSTPVLSETDRKSLVKHLMSYNWNTIQVN